MRPRLPAGQDTTDSRLDDLYVLWAHPLEDIQEIKYKRSLGLANDVSMEPVGSVGSVGTAPGYQTLGLGFSSSV